MIVYQASKTQYLTDVDSNRIHLIIEQNYIQKTGGTVANSELRSWKNSNDYMYRVMVDPQIPEDVQVVIEFKIGMSNRRIDFLIAGRDDQGAEHVILIELKQWSSATLTHKDGIVNTVLGGGLRDTVHPSYQVWSYTVMLEISAQYSSFWSAVSIINTQSAMISFVVPVRGRAVVMVLSPVRLLPVWSK